MVNSTAPVPRTGAVRQPGPPIPASCGHLPRRTFRVVAQRPGRRCSTTRNGRWPEAGGEVEGVGVGTAFNRRVEATKVAGPIALGCSGVNSVLHADWAAHGHPGGRSPRPVRRAGQVTGTDSGHLSTEFPSSHLTSEDTHAVHARATPRRFPRRCHRRTLASKSEVAGEGILIANAP